MKLSEFKTLDKLEDEMFLDNKKQTNIPYKAFVPSKINHKWDFNDIQSALDLAEEVMQVITRLDERINSIADAGIINQEAIIRMIANKESNESSVIEGTQTMIEDAFSDIKLLAPEKRENAEELQNYIKALDYGIDNLSKIPLSEDKEPGKLPLSERLIKSIHDKLMNGVRGGRKRPGEFKDKQNYIGQNEADDISKAIFIPPHPKHTTDLMKDLFELANQESYRPSYKLIIIALLHYQFETVHPFNDGNGRIGRMIIILYLMQHRIINCKGIYLSAYFQKHRDRYYTYLTEIRETANFKTPTSELNLFNEEWIRYQDNTKKHYLTINKWIEFFLNGLKETANDGLKVIASSIALKREYIKTIEEKSKDQREYKTMIAILDAMFEKPFFTAKELSEISKISSPAVNKVILKFIQLDILKEVTGYKRNRNYTLWRFVELFR
jgi:Fic family protein